MRKKKLERGGIRRMIKEGRGKEYGGGREIQEER